MELLRRSRHGVLWLLSLLFLGTLALPCSSADTSTVAGAPDSWSMSLDVTTAKPFINSGGVVFGMEPGATEGFDAGLDQAAPPNPPEGVDVFFQYPDNTGELRKLAVSQVGPAAGETWPLMIGYFAMGPAEGDVIISWDPGAIPGGYAMFLDGVDMSEIGSHTFRAIVPDSQASQLYTFALMVTMAEIEEEDVTPPYTSGHSPAVGATDVAPDTNIVVHVQDDGDGVDMTTIVMTVEGMRVIPAITGTAADYTLTFDPPAGFAYLQAVDITVEATDLAGNVMSRDSYSFTIAEEEDTAPPDSSTTGDPGGTVQPGKGLGFEWWMVGASVAVLIVIGGGVYLFRGLHKKKTL